MIELSFLQISFLIIFGIFIGIISSAMGIGGGAFTVPFLVFVFNMPIKNAIAISLISIIATSSSVASINIEKGFSNVRIGVLLEMAMAVGSIISTLIMMRINPSILELFFSFMLLPVAISMFINAKRKSKKENKNIEISGSHINLYYDPQSQSYERYIVRKKTLASILSFFSGVMSGLFGLGGGIISVPIMTIICGIPIKVATATSNFMIGLSACASALILFINGYVITNVAVFIVIGVLLGGFMGMKLLYKAKSSTLQIAFSILIMILSIRFMIKVL